MRQHALAQLTRARAVWSIVAALVLCVGAGLSAGVAQGRVDPSTRERTATVISPNVVAIVTGGGTVLAAPLDPNVVASFGINGKRPAGFAQDGTGAALGRINYDKHGQVTRRHVNVPVTFMSVELSANPGPNGTGGKANLVGDCTQANVECPSGLPAIQSVLLYVEDNSDTGSGDMFQISYCTGAAQAAPTGCSPTPEGGPIRSGNIQIRASGGSGGSSNIPTAARVQLRKP